MTKFAKQDSQLRFQVKNFELSQKILKTLILNSTLPTCVRRKFT